MSETPVEPFDPDHNPEPDDSEDPGIDGDGTEQEDV